MINRSKDLTENFGNSSGTVLQPKRAEQNQSTINTEKSYKMYYN